MKWFYRISIVVAAFAITASCSEDTQKATINDLSPYARNYLKMNMGGSRQNFMAVSGQGNIIDGSFQRLFNAASFVGGRLAGDTTVKPSDTTIVSEPWVSCGVITTVVNPDGSQTTQYDYGSGCEEGDSDYKYFMFGKYAFTILNTSSVIGTLFKDSYFYNWTSDNYGGRTYYNNDTTEWLSNGTSAYTGESQYDTAKQTYSGSFNYQSDFLYRWDTTEYTYKGHGKNTYSEKQYVIESNTYEYSTKNEYYKTVVLEPLVSRYDCNNYNYGCGDMMYYSTYVSGREFVRFKNGESEGSFEINYGDGICDNIITIIENGKSVEVDVSNQTLLW